MGAERYSSGSRRDPPRLESIFRLTLGGSNPSSSFSGHFFRRRARKQLNERDWEKKLREEGFRHVNVWRDGPNANYPEHTHPVTTAHTVLAGEITMTPAGKAQPFRPGDRFDVPAHTFRSPCIAPRRSRPLLRA